RARTAMRRCARSSSISFCRNASLRWGTHRLRLAMSALLLCREHDRDAHEFVLVQLHQQALTKLPRSRAEPHLRSRHARESLAHLDERALEVLRLHRVVDSRPDEIERA